MNYFKRSCKSSICFGYSFRGYLQSDWNTGKFVPISIYLLLVRKRYPKQIDDLHGISYYKHVCVAKTPTQNSSTLFLQKHPHTSSDHNQSIFTAECCKC